MSDVSRHSGETVYRGHIYGDSGSMRRLAEVETHLLDLDDTIARYEPSLIEGCLKAALSEHTTDLDDLLIVPHARALADSMHIGERQKETLAGTIGVADPLGFWQSYAERFDEALTPEDVTFKPGFLKFLHFVVRNDLRVGVISNALPDTGFRVLDMLEQRSGVELQDRAVFLGFGEDRKPETAALTAYEKVIGHSIDPNRASYVGNSASDLRFGQQTGMVPVFLNHGSNAEDIVQSYDGPDVMSGAVVIDGFCALKNHLELGRPNYRRHISFAVGRPPLAQELPHDNETICLDPSDEAVFRVAHEGADGVLAHVPAIWQAFHDRFDKPGHDFSIVKIPDYHHLFSEANGAFLLPDLAMDTENGARLQAYFTHDRTRDENGHILNRGPIYYRQYIEELKGDGLRQLVFSKKEAEMALNTLEDITATNPEEHRAVLGVEDNLRGNLQSLYLSAINRWRQEGITPLNADDQAEFMEFTERLEDLYEKAVTLQYSHMLGLDYDRGVILSDIRDQLDVVEGYADFCQIRDIVPVFKTPEDDNALLIATRANYLCDQYPETTTLVGLTSGGVELAKVSQLLYRHLHDRETRIINYPISVHNGLSMWSKDRAAPVNQELIDEIVGLAGVKGENVVICEDNSNSGQTLDRVTNRVREHGAARVNFAVVEIDPTRVIMHHVQQKAGHKHVIGQAAEHSRPVANYFHPDFVGAVGVVRILPQDQSFSKVIAMDTANRYNGASGTHGL